MESPKPVGLQESAAEALVSLLTVRSNRKELARDEKSVMRLMQIARWRKPGVQEKTGGRWGSKPLAEAGGDGGRRSQESLAETLQE
nr:hypothetical protein CFP56_28919 [Quercus suber]